MAKKTKKGTGSKNPYLADKGAPISPKARIEESLNRILNKENTGKSSGFVLSEDESKKRKSKLVSPKAKNKRTKKLVNRSKEKTEVEKREHELKNKLFNLYNLFRLIHSKENNSPVILRDIKSRDRALKMMQDFFRTSTDWGETDINMLAQFRMLEEPNASAFLEKEGLGRPINTVWIELGAQPMVDGKRLFTKADGHDSVKSVESTSASRQWLPPASTTYRRIGKKYYYEASDLELTDDVPSMKEISENFDSWMGRMDISSKRMQLNPVSVEPDLPATQMLEPPVVDVPNDTDEPPTYAEEKPLRTPTRQEAIQQAKDRKLEREQRKKSRGYVNKPGAGKPPAESAPKMPPLGGRRSTTSEAAGRGALPGGGGGWRPRKLPPKLRTGGFIPYST